MTETNSRCQLERRALLTRAATFIGGLAAGCTSMAQTNVVRRPPFELPFPLHKAGARIETDVRIVEARSYRFVLQFMFKTPEERKRVFELVGDSHLAFDPRGNLRRPGVTIPVHLTVHTLKNGEPDELLLDQRYDSLGNEGFSAKSFYRFVAAIGLKPGHYRLSVINLQSVPEFAGIESLFYFYSRYL